MHYNPYNCWYRCSFTKGEGEELVRLDRPRLELLVEEIEFDEERGISSVPSWERIVELMTQFDDQPRGQPQPPAISDVELEEWEEGTFGPAPVPAVTDQPPRRGFDDLVDPCGDCSAYCCTTLVFPQSIPGHVSNLDYFRFCLGFPGIELGVADDQWTIIVRTKCRHLSDGRCSLYGDPERPLICT